MNTLIVVCVTLACVRCLDTRQCEIPDILNAIISNGQTGDLKDDGFTLDFKCAVGFILNDNQTVTCNDGNWTFIANCVAVVNISSPDGDTRVCEYETRDNPIWPCSKSCTSDKDCRKNTKCLCDGRCGRSCINPTECRVPAIANVTISSTLEGQWKRPGYILKPKCIDGHMLNDTREMWCQNGAWSVIIGCVPALQCQVPDILNAIIVGGKVGDMIRHDLTIKPKCNEGFYINDTGAVRCWDGEWNIIPSCVADGEARVCEHKRKGGIDKFCTERCYSDRDCAKLKKLCLCDGECGRSCVEPTQCKLPIITNATITDRRKGEYQHPGVTIIPKCDTGLALDDARPVTCMMGNWSFIPKCVPADPCTVPVIMNATIEDALEGDLRDHGTTIQPICDGGFRISNTQAVTCQHGNWSIIPECVPDGDTRVCEYEKPDNPIWACSKSCRSDKDCRRNTKCLCDGRCGRSCVNPTECRVPVIMNATIKGKREGQWRKDGFIVKVICAQGLVLNDTREMKCENGAWPVILGCVPARQCQVPVILNATIVGGKSGDWISHDLTIKPKCNEGFYINDTGAVRCRDGEWSIIPSCVADGDTRTCEYTRPYGIDKSCLLRCHSDRNCAKLKRFCLCDGECGRSCIMTTQCKLPILMNATITGRRKGEYQNSDVTIIPKCDPGFVLDDARPVTCMNGTWSIIPKCVPDGDTQRCGYEVRTSRNCSKSCHSDRDCTDLGGKCLCDGRCARSCILPTHCRVPYFVNGTVFGEIKDWKEDNSFIEIACNPGFVIINGTNRITCENGSWSNIPQCVRSPCKVPDIENAQISDRQAGDLIEHGFAIKPECNVGFYINQHEQVICNRGSWTTIPTCVADGYPRECEHQRVDDRKLKCRRICHSDRNCFGQGRQCLCDGMCGRSCINPDQCRVPALDNGTFTGVKEREWMNNGFTLTPTCDKGLVINNSRPATCTYGTWSIIPSCVPARCKKPKHPSHGKYHGSNYTPTSVITLTCDNGYNLVGENERTCQDDGTWSGQAGICEVVTCKKLEDPELGTYVGTNFTFNSVVTLVCQLRYTVDGPRDRTCQADGTWSDHSATCKVSCGLPSEYEHAYPHYNGMLDQSTVNYTCDPGYGRFPSKPDFICLNGRWTGYFHGCKKYFDCDTPGIPENSVLIGERETPYTYKSMIIVYCLTGYTLVGNEKRYCLADRTWSEAPTCEKDCQCPPPQVENGENLSSNCTHGTSVPYKCNDGYKLGSSNTALTCSKGVWVGEKPMCVEDSAG